MFRHILFKGITSETISFYVYDEIHECHVLELRIETNVYGSRCFFLRRYLSSSEKGLNGGSNLDFCDAGAPFQQLSHRVNWELVFMRVDDKHVDDGYRYAFMIKCMNFMYLCYCLSSPDRKKYD